MSLPLYGSGDASFRAAGGEQGIQRLVESFYEAMDGLPEASIIRAMHPEDLVESIDKLACFLCGWLGGPKRYAERYGSISIPGVHVHLNIEEAERDAWLACMKVAVSEQPWNDEFRAYFMRQIAVPAERVRSVCTQQKVQS